jgi:hypothetical protein
MLAWNSMDTEVPQPPTSRDSGAAAPKRTLDKVDPLPGFQACERSPENEADGEDPTETCPDPADSNPNLIAGPAKPLKTDEKRVAAVDDTIAASASIDSSKLEGQS